MDVALGWISMAAGSTGKICALLGGYGPGRALVGRWCGRVPPRVWLRVACCGRSVGESVGDESGRVAHLTRHAAVCRRGCGSGMDRHGEAMTSFFGALDPPVSSSDGPYTA